MHRPLFVVLIVTALFIWRVLGQTSSVTTPTPAQISSSSTILQACTAKLPDPILIPLRNVSFGDGLMRRGLQTYYGTPPQSLAMILSNDDNNTYVVNTAAVCDGNITRQVCSVTKGGLFDENSSSTFSLYSNLSAPGTVPVLSGDQHITDMSGTDVLKIGTDATISQFPVGIYHKTRPVDNVLGVLDNSSVIRSLKESHAIASSSYGFTGGWSGAEMQHQMDGGLVFGGFDAAKVRGSNVTLPINYQSCLGGLQVTVSDMTMNLQNGTNASIIGHAHSSAFQACVETGYDNEIPLDVWSRFLAVSGSEETGRTTAPFNFYTMLVDAGSAYTGDLTLTIFPDLEVRIPNHQLVLPDYGIDDNGQKYIQNTSNRNVLLYSLQDVNKNDMPTLGRLFLSSAYMFVNYDENSFTLWSAVPTTDTKLTAVGPTACSSSSPVPTTAPPIITQLPSPDRHSVLPTSTLIGTIIGSIAVVALSCLAAFLFSRRKKRQRLAKEAPSKEDRDDGMESRSSLTNFKKVTAGFAPQEISTDKEPPRFLAPYELAARQRAVELAARERLNELATVERINELATQERVHEMP